MGILLPDGGAADADGADVRGIGKVVESEITLKEDVRYIKMLKQFTIG